MPRTQSLHQVLLAVAPQIGEDPICVPLAVDEHAVVGEDDEVEGRPRARGHAGSLKRGLLSLAVGA